MTDIFDQMENEEDMARKRKTDVRIIAPELGGFYVSRETANLMCRTHEMYEKLRHEAGYHDAPHEFYAYLLIRDQGETIRGERRHDISRGIYLPEGQTNDHTFTRVSAESLQKVIDQLEKGTKIDGWTHLHPFGDHGSFFASTTDNSNDEKIVVKCSSYNITQGWKEFDMRYPLTEERDGRHVVIDELTGREFEFPHNQLHIENLIVREPLLMGYAKSFIVNGITPDKAFAQWLTLPIQRHRTDYSPDYVKMNIRRSNVEPRIIDIDDDVQMSDEELRERVRYAFQIRPRKIHPVQRPKTGKETGEGETAEEKGAEKEPAAESQEATPGHGTDEDAPDSSYPLPWPPRRPSPEDRIADWIRKATDWLRNNYRSGGNP